MANISGSNADKNDRERAGNYNLGDEQEVQQGCVWDSVGITNPIQEVAHSRAPRVVQAIYAPHWTLRCASRWALSRWQSIGAVLRLFCHIRFRADHGPICDLCHSRLFERSIATVRAGLPSAALCTSTASPQPCCPLELTSTHLL